MALFEKLQKVQYEMKAPKNLYNSFGKYSYRNAEGILEAFKPYGDKHKLILTLTDKVENIGESNYICAKATLTDVEDGTFIETTAYAREALDKKGMDDSQITGTASSYARKYALNGLFLLDDTKDADTNEYAETQKAADKKADAKPIGKLTKSQLGKILAELKRTGITEKCITDTYKVNKLEELTGEQANNAIARLEKTKDADTGNA